MADRLRVTFDTHNDGKATMRIARALFAIGDACYRIGRYVERVLGAPQAPLRLL